MRTLRNTVLPMFVAALWINFCEFVRNQFWLMPIWVKHYKDMGLVFPAAPINGAVWGIWGVLFAVFVVILSKRFSLLHTVLLCWLAGFVFMWLVIGNMGVLPFEILPYAIPLSFVEVLGAAWFAKLFNKG